MANGIFGSGEVSKATRAGAGKGALTGISVTAPVAGGLIASGVGAPLGLALLGGGALVGGLIGAISASKQAKDRRKLEKEAEAAAEAQSVEAAKQAKAAQGRMSQAARAGFPVPEEDAALVLAAGGGTAYDTWRRGVFE